MLLRSLTTIAIVIFCPILNQNSISAKELICRCLMNDSNCWPSLSAWQRFNQSIDGRLISVQSPIEFCVGNPPNRQKCLDALTHWTNATWRSEQAGAMQSYNWENISCSEQLGNVSCTPGSVPRLAVNATLVEHVQATINFARSHNLRLAIKTTGHDYLGRSTAADSLLLWLHYMKNKTLIEQYRSCTGENILNAIRVDAGVQWGEVYSWLSIYNLTAIGGASPTVGAIGGYLQGGGHGPLTRWKGMAADQVLEFDVITADGQRLLVNACQNKDLFWALRGGGGGTFAVVLSAVLRTYYSPSMSSVLYRVSASNETRYANLIRDFIHYLPKLADAGYAGYFYMTDTNITIAFFAPDANFTTTSSLFERFMKNNTDLSVTANFTFELPTFYSYFSEVMENSNPTGGQVLLGSRLIPETIIRRRPDQVADAFVRTRGRSEHKTLLIGHLVAGGKVSNVSIDNSINPLWRTALLHMVIAYAWDDNVTNADQIIIPSRLRTLVDILETVSGNEMSGCYLNEADPYEPNWQLKYFGNQANYDRLKSIKKKFDPSGLFICKNCIGSDEWSMDLNCLKQSCAFQNQAILFLLILTNLFHFF